MQTNIDYPPDEKKRILDAIEHHFADAFDEQIGILKATQLFEFFDNLIGTRAYNRGIEDAHTWLQQKIGDMEVDLLKRVENA